MCAGESRNGKRLSLERSNRSIPSNRIDLLGKSHTQRRRQCYLVRVAVTEGDIFHPIMLFRILTSVFFLVLSVIILILLILGVIVRRLGD